VTSPDYLALAPLLLLSLTALAVMLAAAFFRGRGVVETLTLAGLTAAGLALAWAWPVAPRQVSPLLIVDGSSLFFTGLMIAGALVVALLSRGYPGLHARPDADEYYILLVLATAGAVVLVSSVHFASFFLGLEILSVALYALVAYPRANRLSLEAGVKYLILAGASSAFLLFGMALVYAEVGALDLPRLAAAAAGAQGLHVLALAGVGLIVVGLGFKLSLVPFHLWAADVYQGAPAPATAFVATISKGAVLALLLRYRAALGPDGHDALAPVLTVLAVASMFAGNWLALLQRNVKRLLAFSSIAHMGYVLVALRAGGAWGASAVAIYLVAYVVTTLGAFGIVAALSTATRDADAPEDYAGLAWRRPWLAGVFTLMLLSLAGIPLTVGFIGKFYVLAAGLHAGLWLLAIALVVNSAIGLFYYLRVVVTLFRPRAETAPPAPAARVSWSTAAALALVTVLLLGLGLYPAPALRLLLTLGF
jgi:NADH-quinone oxidoreductase subunit N